jgi:subtilisin family serine protease
MRVRILFLLFFVALLSGIIVTCGPAVDPKILTDFDSDASLPNMDNFKRWSPTWKRGTWVVSLEDRDWKLGSAARLAFYLDQTRSALLGGASDLFAATNSSESARIAFAKVIDQKLEVDWIGLKPALETESQSVESNSAAAPTDTSNTDLSFLAVTLREPSDLIQSITTIFGEPTSALTKLLGVEKVLDREHFAALWQYRSLGNLPGAKWVEPNLYSTYTTVSKGRTAASVTALDDPIAPQTKSPYVPPEFEFSASMADKLRLIKADLAYTFTGQGTEDRRPINVAVLDTGVDYKHPDLENQMWINAGETAGNNQDDDGNGVVDDIHGFDATLASNGDGGADPKPGAADLGGPGANCPTPPARSSAASKKDELKANCGHGTHVAGIIAAQHGADLYTLGVCPNCRIMSVRVAERCLQPETDKKQGECVLPTGPLREDQYEVDGNIADTAQIRALSYLLKTRSGSNRGSLAVNVVNMSLGKYFKSRSMAYLIQKLQDSNVVVVAAAGNDDTDTPSFPAAYASVVAVCATSNEAHRGTFGKAQFSNFGEWVDICAPGQDIVSTIPGKQPNGSGNRTDKNGTSQATPFVAGAIGYLMSVSPVQRDAKQFINILKKAANFNDLYFAKQNLISATSKDSAYLACYKDKSSCDYLLGTGFLNLSKAVNPAAPERFSDVDLNPQRQVSGQCVGSTIGSGQFSMLQFLSSMPVLMSHVPLILWFLRIRRRNRHRNPISM